MIARGKTSLAEREVLWKARKDNPIAEYHVPLTLKTLREIDKDRAKLDEFLANRFPRINGKTTNFIVVRLMLEPGDAIKSTDIEYLWDLLNISGNDVAVPPILSWPRMSPFDNEAYKKFVKGFVSLSTSYQPDKLACVIPWGLPRSEVAEVISLYKSLQPNVYVADFGGKKPFVSAQEIIMSALLRKVRELHKNKYYLYGFDIKPYKQGGDERPAENVLLLASGFNAIGPRRSRTRLTKEMVERIKKIGPRPITETMQIFSPQDYGFHKMVSQQQLERFEEWMPSIQSAENSVRFEDIHKKDPVKIRVFERLGKAFNFAQQCPEATVLVKKVDEDTLKKHLLSKVQAKEIIPKIEKIKKKAAEKN